MYYTFSLYLEIKVDRSKSYDEIYSYIKELGNGCLLRFIREVEQNKGMKLEEFYISDIHVGSETVTDADLGRGYGAIDAEDPAFITFNIGSYVYDDISTIANALENNTDFDFIDDVSYEKRV